MLERLVGVCNQSVSSAYGARPATNPTLRMYDQVTLQTAATETGVSVFSFPSSLLAGCTGLTIIAPAGQLVLINIPGTTNSISDFQITLQGGVDAAHVLWNYYESTSLSIENVYVIGTTIAPSAAVTFTAGQLHGALYAGSISGIGEYHPQVRCVRVLLRLP
jgi:choice-of-anchor A domain-containing protein